MAKQQTAAPMGWSRIIDYLFGRNALIAVASIMLLLISGFATWSGMNDFIVGAAQDGGRQAGSLPVSEQTLVIFITIALTFLMWLALREAIGPQRRLIERMVTWPLYLFLAIWSIGFGYGFWWALIAGQEATRNSMAALQEDARDATTSISARLDAVKAQVDSFVTWSESQMAREESSGGSCGVPSGAGRGPLYNARRSTRDSVAGLRDTIANSWLGPVNAELETLRKVAVEISGSTPEERQRNFNAMSAQVRGSARTIASRSNELGRSTASEMRALADSVSVAPGQSGFSCYDPTLAQRLRQAADQAAVPAEVKLRAAAFNEGPAGVANAVKNLWANIGFYTWNGIMEAVTLGAHETPPSTADPITGRDVIALLATIGIDLGLFVLALLSPPSAAPVRRDALAEQQSRLHLATGPVVRQIEAAIKTAVARAPDAGIEWVRQHFIHHDGSSYFVIPNLYAAERAGPDSRKEELRALAMNQLAGVFADLKLVRALSATELKALGKEESRISYSDLTPYRARVGQQERSFGDRMGDRMGGLIPRGKATPASDPKPAGAPADAKPAPTPAPTAMEVAATVRVKPGEAAPRGPLRNHGLLSKAQRTLDIAGWSEAAQADVELFKLVDQDGLTPLLAVLNEATLERVQTSGSAPSAAPAGSGSAPPPAAKPTPAAAKPADVKDPGVKV